MPSVFCLRVSNHCHKSHASLLCCKLRRIQVGQRADRSPATQAHLLRRDHLREQLLQARPVRLGTLRGDGQLQRRRPVHPNPKAAPDRTVRRACCWTRRASSRLSA